MKFYVYNLFIVLQLGGLNSLLGVESTPSLPIVSKAPTLILGMDVSHGSPGQTDIPSIAAVSDITVVCSQYIVCGMHAMVLSLLDVLLFPVQ
jgi:hypothetical protein